jgi:ethanolamine ammonia-lyase small subunit
LRGIIDIGFENPNVKKKLDKVVQQVLAEIAQKGKSTRHQAYKKKQILGSSVRQTFVEEIRQAREMFVKEIKHKITVERKMDIRG